ncbi:phage portal protein [Bacillus toyonensis]|uniref:phage portal protein n=1 Tax=Bacillus toyonensis TaxID=155322 RepID=UPI0020D23E17|nr:phage portal protein [Bacillus toyonensis]
MGGKNYNGKPYEPRKILLQYGKLIVNLEATYLLKNPVTVIGDEKIIVDFKKVYKKGKYDKVDFDILIHIVKYGNVYEYVYVNKKGQFTMMN